ncbi:helix-turn-helix domain-containing protein [Methylobacterium tarhaniae]|uniref:helix-turn-helix domain-containing protein n=1 Tax=Methylobacterium tarhaniae TaxID=1187852 RepID=UPI00142E35F9|nr:helix-turn-helix domain-containing protein [Methylobacterium tarhaniae]
MIQTALAPLSLHGWRRRTIYDAELDGTVPIPSEDEIKRSIGKKIREYRLTRGYSRLKLGMKIGISDAQIFKYEAGQDHVRASVLWQISEALEVPVILLFGSSASSGYTDDEPDYLSLPDEATIFAAFRRIAPPDIQARVARLILALAVQDGESQGGSSG